MLRKFAPHWLIPHRSRREYQYAILHLQTSLRDPSQLEPLAVIAEDDQSRQMVVVGRHLSDDEKEGISENACAYLADLPNLLIQQVEEAVESGHEDNVVTFLSSVNRWNLLVSPPESIKTHESIFLLTLRLFVERILGAELAAREELIQEPTSENLFLETLPITPKGAVPLGA